MRGWKEWRRRRCWEWPLCQRTDCFLEASECLILDLPRLSICFLNGKKKIKTHSWCFLFFTFTFISSTIPTSFQNRYWICTLLITSTDTPWSKALCRFPISSDSSQGLDWVSKSESRPLYLIVPWLEQWPSDILRTHLLSHSDFDSNGTASERLTWLLYLE